MALAPLHLGAPSTDGSVDGVVFLPPGRLWIMWGPPQPHGRPGHPGRPKYLQQLLLGLLAGCRGFIAVLPAGERIRVAALFAANVSGV
jgi:hypothetical protein